MCEINGYIPLFGRYGSLKISLIFYELKCNSTLFLTKKKKHKFKSERVLKNAVRQEVLIKEIKVIHCFIACGHTFTNLKYLVSFSDIKTYFWH